MDSDIWREKNRATKMGHASAENRHSVMDEPSLISYLRTCDTSPNNELAATIKGNSTKNLGIRPRILAYNEDGSKVYGLNGKQVAKILAIYDCHEYSLL